MGMLPAVLILASAPLLPTDTDPAAVVQRATAAIEGDSVSAVERQWNRAVTRDRTDRAARLGLATLARLTYRDTAAERLYRSLLRPDAAADGIAVLAGTGLAQLFVARGDWRRADSAATRAVAAGRTVADPAATAEALAVLALVRTRIDGPASANAVLDEADAIVPDVELRIRARLRCYRAQVRMLAGDPGAVDLARSGAELAGRAADARVRADCLTVAANEHARRDEADAALDDYREAISDYRRARDRGGLAVALQWRSYLHLTIGLLGHARRDAEAAIAEATVARRDNVVPWARSTLAWVAFRLGDAITAAEHAAAARALFSGQDDRYATINARQLEATLALVTRDLPLARHAHADVIIATRQLGWAGAEVHARQGLMHVALAQGDLTAARRELAAAHALAEAGGSGWSPRFGYHAGVLALREGALEAAERNFRDGLTAAGLAAQSEWRYLNGARLAEALVRQGRLAEAEREILAAAQALDEWRERLEDRDLRLLALQLAEDVTDPDLGVATVVAALADAGRLAAAFELVERERARDLTDQLSRASAADPGVRTAAIRGERHVALDSLQRALPDDDTAIFEYVTGLGDPTTLFVITRTHARAYVLASQDSLGAPIARFGALLEAGADPRALGRTLGAALLGPALRDLDPGVRRLIVIPDGPLHRLPFDALVLPDGRFVIEQFAVASAPAASVVARLWQRRSEESPEGMVVFADPRFAREPASLAASGSAARPFAESPRLPRLRGASREARALARYSDDATVLRRRAASEAWLKRTPLERFGIVHFATHALVDGRSIVNTALALAPGDDEDGFVSPAELAELRLGAELVVLSACRTAGGVLVRGEGVQGLAASLLAAGARAVAITWWPIGDRATVRMMDDFYGAMAEGQQIIDALRSAKLAALDRAAPPVEWAAFTIIGDPLALPRLRPPANRALTARSIGLGLAVPLFLTLSLTAICLSRRRRALRNRPDARRRSRGRS